MHFLKHVLNTVDGIWSLLTIPCLLLMGFYVIYAIPIPFLILVIIYLLHKVKLIEYYDNLVKYHNTQHDNMYVGEYSPEKAEHNKNIANNIRVKAFLVLMFSVIVYSAVIWLFTTPYYLCKDYSGYIPFTLPEILQKFLPHSC